MVSDMIKTDWQAALIDAVTDPRELLELLEIDLTWLEEAKAAATLFPLKVPREFISRMQKRNINDPLLRQVLPMGDEFKLVEGFEKDPWKEEGINPVPGLLHRYHGRVLLTLTGSCSINCRFCFRRHFPYAKNNPGRPGWQHALSYITNDQTITEVILSGGDPLIMNDPQLFEFTTALSQISHLKRLRIHTRMPIVLPSRITPELVNSLMHTRLQPVMVVHCNHPQEITQAVINAIKKLTIANITLLNQAVLLKGINDNAETLVTLSETLFAAGILPYYLHVLDKVEGCSHFDLERETAQNLHWQITQRLPGYLVPKLVRTQAGASAKVRVDRSEFYTG
ncbi:MAG: epmB [Gammaproteobacteria bacterium]|jgi:EF-P beta-lysylation protein EpmB|nr:epmB [Gammaproteobacteria bacterium]